MQHARWEELEDWAFSSWATRSAEEKLWYSICKRKIHSKSGADETRTCICGGWIQTWASTLFIFKPNAWNNKKKNNHQLGLDIICPTYTWNKTHVNMTPVGTEQLVALHAFMPLLPPNQKLPRLFLNYVTCMFPSFILFCNVWYSQIRSGPKKKKLLHSPSFRIIIQTDEKTKWLLVVVCCFQMLFSPHSLSLTCIWLK